MNESEKPVCGIPWYRRDQWDQWHETSVDPLSASYDQWLAAAELTAQDLARRGMEIYRVEIDVNLFQAWLATQSGLKNDGPARASYAERQLEA